MFRNILYSEISHLATFDALIQNGFRVIYQIAFVYLCKSYDLIIIPFFNFQFEW